MNNLLKDLTDLAEDHHLSITNLSIQEIGGKVATAVGFEKDNRTCVGTENGNSIRDR